MDTSSTNKRTREEAERKKVNVMKASEEPPAKAINVRRRPAPNVLRATQEGTCEGDNPRVAPGTKAENTAGDDEAKAVSKSSAAAREVGPGATDVEMTAAGGVASKRAREASDSIGNVGTSGTGEPPTKIATGRRPTLKPRPNLPPDRGETPTPPPP
ncbi:hypothetical protein HPB52_004089 [Rhipicephalus sanguineus]|uniref:Uncharacterized protein n=1 Tax=Rhipicephalus sanguineus TaxID=34632 RepID=A0A9D4QH43_RHISA|nr:hypothetical protein HPB52_004089 [Rhipicephalus sanguineus]